MFEEKLSEITISNVLSVVKTNIKGGSRLSRVNRESSAFVLKLAGKTYYTQDGVEYISDSSHIVFLPKGSNYTTFIAEEGDCILFELEFDETPPFSKITVLPVKNSPDIASVAQKAERNWTYKKHGFRNKCMAAIYNIISNVINEKSYVTSDKYELIKPSIAYLEEHLDDPCINTEFLSSMTDVSLPYFRKIFYEIYNVPVAKYIESVRIRKAKELLKSDCASISEIAELVGYRNIYHFSKSFKKVTGVSPTEYSRIKY